MMLIATGLAVALASAAAPAAAAPAEAAPASLPPVVVSVIEVPGIPPALVSRLLAETDEIWRAAGIPFLWRRSSQRPIPDPRTSDTGPYLPSTLRVIIGNDKGVARDQRTPLGWIVFENEHTPQPEIYVSYKNAQALLAASRVVVGAPDRMPIVQREILLARAMGRALAHEVGHYLLASKVHTSRGLLKASRTAAELFAAERGSFRIDPWQQQTVAARLLGEPVVAQRWP
jgi:hypothetical protein